MKKYNIFLDLDQTLVSAEEYGSFKFTKRAEKFKYKIMDKNYVIFMRNYLDVFLDFLFDNFNVSVWTAGSKDYALFIVANIICTNSKRKLDLLFFSYHCTLSQQLSNHPKFLPLLWTTYKLKKFTKLNTIIIDDNKRVYHTQEENCYNIKPFFYNKKNSEKDKELLKLMTFLKTILEK